MKINTLNIAKDLGKSLERLLIVLSLMYCMLFLIDIPIYVNYIYILALTCMYILYFYISKMELEASYVTILSTALLGYIYVTTIHAGQLPYKEIKLLILVNASIMLQLNSLIFRKHYKFAIKSLILALLAFFVFFSIQITTSNEGAFFLIEQYFDNVGIFAIFIALSTIVILNFIKELELKQTKLIYMFLLLISLICILLLESRTAFIILLLFLLLSNLKYIKSKKIKIVSLSIFAVLILIPITLIKQDSSSGRLFIWKTTGQIIKDNPIYGVGYDKFGVVYPIYQASMYEAEVMSDKDIYVADNTKMALNEYLQITAELGLIGFILLVLLVFTYIYYEKNILICICASA